VRQRVVCSPAAFERRVRSVRNQADSLLSTHAQRKLVSGLAAPELPGGWTGQVEDASRPAVRSPDRVEGATEPQPGLFDPSSPQHYSPNAEVPGLSGSVADLPAGCSGQTRNGPESDGPGDGSPGLTTPGTEVPDDCPGRARCAELPSGSGGPFGQPVPDGLLDGPLLEEDGLPAPQRVRLVVDLSAEEYAEWGATVARISRQFGRRVSSREVILELARRHVASTGGSSLQRNPVVVRLEPDGAGFVQTDRGPLVVSRQSSDEYLARANSVVVQGSQPTTTSVLLLGGRRRKKLPAEVLRSVVARAGGCCESCGQHGILHVHHIRALSRGGSNGLENLRLLCSACHGGEHASDFQPGSPWERARARRQRVSAQKASAQSSRGRPARPTGPDP
jgi:5-methylcytosine-specific restriction endonuclease McrA